MDLNTLVFPAPSVSWNYNDFLGELLWIPAKRPEVELATFNRRVIELAEKVDIADPGISTRLLRKHHRKGNSNKQNQVGRVLPLLPEGI